MPAAATPSIDRLSQPDTTGHFGPFGGSVVAETLTHALDELRAPSARYKNDPEFVAEYRH